MSRYLRLSLIVVIGLSCVLVSLLVAASENTAFFERYYRALLWTNTAVMVVFLAIVGSMLAGVYRNTVNKKYGIKLLTKFVVTLCLTSVLPSALVFLVSVQFLYRSVDSWFGVKVERALDSGLTLGREVLGNFQDTLKDKAQKIAEGIAVTPPSNWVTALTAAAEKEGLQEAYLVNSAGQFLAVTGSSFGKLAPAFPSVHSLQTAKSEGSWQQIDDSDPEHQKAQVIVPVPFVEISGPFFPSWAEKITPLKPGLRQTPASRESVFLEVTMGIPPSLANNAEALMSGYRDYQETALTRAGLRTIYLITLALVLLVTTCCALAGAIIMANRISRPLMLLLQATQKVGEGQYERVPEVKTRDEVGELARSFNIMTDQLADARRSLERRGEELGQAKNYLERILAKMSSGVIVLDSRFNTVSANTSAAKILGVKLTEELGRPIQKILPGFAEKELKKLLEEEGGRPEDINVQTEYQPPNKSKGRLSLFLRLTQLRLGDEIGYLLVFDDVTALVSAQRTEAWGEVARRLAHEIKNPLTPIQLAAERLEAKLNTKVEGKDREILERATRTIVDQVTAMKQMVDDFRLYAKIGTPRYDKLDLAAFIEEVGHFYQAAGVHIRLELIEPLPFLEADENQLRQIFNNLLSNAMEAAPDKEHLSVTIRAQAVLSEEGEPEGIEVSLTDNGPGFTNEILDRAFEPYVTTKSQGTGLGLATIKKIAEEHRASVMAENSTDEKGRVLGARVILLFRRFWKEKPSSER